MTAAASLIRQFLPGEVDSILAEAQLLSRQITYADWKGFPGTVDRFAVRMFEDYLGRRGASFVVDGNPVGYRPPEGLTFDQAVAKISRRVRVTLSAAIVIAEAEGVRPLSPERRGVWRSFDAENPGLGLVYCLALGPRSAVIAGREWLQQPSDVLAAVRVAVDRWNGLKLAVYSARFGKALSADDKLPLLAAQLSAKA